jgi:threonine synthase
VAAQAVYYFTAASSLGSPHRPVSFAVPTGNFGDILAGWVAKRMGLPIEQLMIGTNANDILARTLSSGSYEIKGVQPTASPSMDIQISSNVERLLFEAYGRDAGAIRRLMASLTQARAFLVDAEPLRRIREEFSAMAVDEANVAAEMAETYQATGYVLDPHTAVGTRAARALLKARPETPVVALSTAHPAKFPDAVERATGVRPALPPHMADLMGSQESFTVLPNDQSAVERFIRERARAVRGVAA